MIKSDLGIFNHPNLPIRTHIQKLTILTGQRQISFEHWAVYVQLVKHGCVIPFKTSRDEALPYVAAVSVNTPRPRMDTISSWTDRTFTESVYSGAKRLAVVVETVILNFRRRWTGFPYNVTPP